MGVNDEYSRDAYVGDHYVYDSDDSDDFDPFLDAESWQDMYSEELLYAWGKIQEYVHAKYLVLDRNCTYPSFVEFVMEPHLWHPTQTPAFHSAQIWNKIKNTHVVGQRVWPENFYTWMEQYIE